ncbi:MAG: rhomboid family intramembrane serine protease [Saprospiraceae bacterium]
MFRLTDVVRNLLILNVLFYLAYFVVSEGIMNSLALRYPGSPEFRPWQFVTYFFMHSRTDFGHILFNMLGLVIFGGVLEMVWGPRRFLAYYILCALGAAALHIFIIHLEISTLNQAIGAFQAAPSYDTFWQFFKHIQFSDFIPQLEKDVINLGNLIHENANAYTPQAVNLMQQLVIGKAGVPMVGASGAIFGLLLAYGIKFPENELIIFPIPVPVKAKYYIPLLIVAEFFFGVQRVAGDNVAHFAHLGGALMGLILILFGRYTGKSF